MKNSYSSSKSNSCLTIDEKEAKSLTSKQIKIDNFNHTLLIELEHLDSSFDLIKQKQLDFKLKRKLNLVCFEIGIFGC